MEENDVVQVLDSLYAAGSGIFGYSFTQYTISIDNVVEKKELAKESMDRRYGGMCAFSV